MPIHPKKKWGIAYAIQPVFAQYWGICFRPFESKISKVFESKKEIIQNILEKIPANLRLFEYQFSPAFDYPTPLIWKGFTINPRFTLQINLEPDLEEVWSHFSDGAKRDVRKAEKAGIEIREIHDLEPVINLFLKTRGDRVKSVKAIEYKRLNAVFRRFHASGESFSLGAFTAENQFVAGILFFRFRDMVIYYFGGTEKEFRNSGAMSAIIWTAIQQNHGKAKCFDFDGSMIESIERFYRSFGSVPVPYLQVRKARVPFSWMK